MQVMGSELYNNLESSSSSEILPPTYVYLLQNLHKNNIQGKLIKFVIPDLPSFDTWKNTFEQLNKVSLRISHSSKSKSYLLHRNYVCHHNASHGVIGRGKHTGCPFRMFVSIRKPFLCEVKLIDKHNHSLDSEAVLKRLRVSDSTDDRIKELFLNGHTIKSVRSILLDEIKADLNDKDLLPIKLADRSIYPDESYCRRIYQNMKKRYGTDEDLDSLIKKYIDDANGENVIKYMQVEDNMYISICTPIMQRVHESLKASGELVFVASSGYMDNSMLTVFLFMTQSCAGGLPLAIGISTSESESSLVELFQLIREVIPENSFYGRGELGPTLFMTDDSPAEYNALKTVWPEAQFCRRSNNTNNIVESAMKVLKDQILEKTNGFDTAQLVELLLIKFGEYFAIKTIDYAHGRLNQKVHPVQPETYEFDFNKIDENNYTVVSSKNKNINYYINAKERTCTCLSSLYNEECKHLKFILSIDSIIDSSDLNLNQKSLMFYISTGKYPKKGWLLPLNTLETVNMDNETNQCPKITAKEDIITLNDFLNGQETVAEHLIKSMELKESYKKIISDKIDWLFNQNTSGAVSAVASFAKQLEKLNETSMITALHQFSKSIEKDKKIKFTPVQKTAFARRKKLAKGRQVSSPGHQRNINIDDHNYEICNL